MREEAVSRRNASTMEDSRQRQYHIGLAPGELAETILLCGDPERAEKCANYFDEIIVKRKNREYITYTGKYHDIDVSVMSTGIGPDNTEIAFIESINITKEPLFLRIGTCGALQKHINPGDMVISTAAVRLENTSTYFVPEGYPAVADYRIVQVLKACCEKLKIPYHIGITATAPGFYGAQGRITRKLKPLKPDLVQTLSELNVLNFEMEASTLFTLSSIKNLSAGAVCVVVANRITNAVLADSEKQVAEKKCIETGLNAIEIIRKNKKLYE